MRRCAIATIAITLAACGRINFEPGDGRGSVPLVCGPAYLPTTDLPSKYRLGSGAANWFAAQADCESDGGHLAVIESVAENAFVTSQVSGEALWIGLTDHVQEGTYVWVTGKPMAFESFGVNEPNDNGGEDCIQAFDDGVWNDKGCRSGDLLYVCECDLDPLPDAPTYCDTETRESCGECGTTCGTVCTNQVCDDPS